MDDPDVTVFELTVTDAGGFEYDADQLVGYTGGPVVFRSVDTDGNVIHERRGDDFSEVLRSMYADAAASFSSTSSDEHQTVIRRNP